MRALTAILGLWVTTGCVTHRSLPLTPPRQAADAWIAPEYAVGIGVGLVAIPLGTLIGVVRGRRIVYEAR